MDTLGAALGECHLFHAARDELLSDIGSVEQAHEADRRALGLTANPAEQSVLRQRLAWT